MLAPEKSNLIFSVHPIPSSRRYRLASGVFDQHAFGFFPLRQDGRSRAAPTEESIYSEELT